jgi:2-methylisocitrate lyase-like PEP mutase family enzyme
MLPMTNPQRDAALLFDSLHRNQPVLVLANAWDAASARIGEAAGANAVATTSAGVAWSLGVADGDQLGRDAALDVVARVVAAVGVPVTADIESGYADSPTGVAETIRGVLAAGAVGVNIEDGCYDGTAPLRDLAGQAERIAAARSAADDAQIPLFINARVDTYLRAVGDPGGRLQDALDRAAAYVAAGASGVFVPGVGDPATISALVAGIDAPLNVLVGPGSPTVADLGALGVARISAGSSIAAAAYSLAQRAVGELLGSGTYTSLAGALTHGELNGLFQRAATG